MPEIYHGTHRRACDSTHTHTHFLGDHTHFLPSSFWVWVYDTLVPMVKRNFLRRYSVGEYSKHSFLRSHPSLLSWYSISERTVLLLLSGCFHVNLFPHNPTPPPNQFVISGSVTPTRLFPLTSTHSLVPSPLYVHHIKSWGELWEVGAREGGRLLAWSSKSGVLVRFWVEFYVGKASTNSNWTQHQEWSKNDLQP